MRRVIVCGPPHSGKSVFLANLMRRLPPDSFYLAYAAPDGEWHWSNFGDQDLVAVVRQKGAFTDDFVSSMVEAIKRNEQPLVLVDTGGVRSEANEAIFSACDGCVILSSKPEEIAAWREFAQRFGVAVLAELDSVLHGTSELYVDAGDGVVRGRIAGLERGQTIASPVLDAVVDALKKIIQKNSAFTLAEMQAHINGVMLVRRLGIEDGNDPFLGIRPAHLQAALRLYGAAAQLPCVRVWNVRAAILASAFAARLPGGIELYDVAKGYVKISEVTPQGEGASDVIEWEVLLLPELTLVKWRNRRFVTVDDLASLVPPSVDTTKPVIVINDGPPMWVHATLVRAYARAGVPWVAQFWPVESGREQSQLGGKRWDEVHPFAGPSVVVAGPEEKIGEVVPISFDLLRWGSPIVGRLASGEPVFDRKDSHAATHSTVAPFLGEGLSRLSSDGRENVGGPIEFGVVLGEDIRVETTDADEIVYAQRPHRPGLSRFVKNREPGVATTVTLYARRITGGAYVLITAFLGTPSPAEPWDDTWATEESIPFWNTHALVWGREEVLPGTETKICPW